MWGPLWGSCRQMSTVLNEHVARWWGAARPCAVTASSTSSFTLTTWSRARTHTGSEDPQHSSPERPRAGGPSERGAGKARLRPQGCCAVWGPRVCEAESQGRRLSETKPLNLNGGPNKTELPGRERFLNDCFLSRSRRLSPGDTRNWVGRVCRTSCSSGVSFRAPRASESRHGTSFRV